MILATMLSVAALAAGDTAFDLDDSVFDVPVLKGYSLTVEWPANQCETGAPLGLEPALTYEDYADEEPVDESLIDDESDWEVTSGDEDWFYQPVIQLLPWRARYYENGGELWYDERCLDGSPEDAAVEYVEPMGTTP